jgi:putative DNA primase/helicase
VRLIIIDPISAYLGHADSNVNAEVRGLLSPLVALAARHAVAVLCVTHLRKSAGAAVHRAIASIAFTAAARAVWAVAPDPANPDRKLMLPVKQNLAPDSGGLAFTIGEQSGVPWIEWQSEAVNLNANDVLNIEDREDHSERKEAEDWLQDYLADGPVVASEIKRVAKGAGVTSTTLWRAARSLRVVKRKLGGRGAGWEWSLEGSSGKESSPISKDLDSLISSANQSKTKPDSGANNSKNPCSTDVECLPLATDGKDEDEIRL